MATYLKTYWQFFGSILLGIIIWLFTFAFLPVNTVEPFKTKTVLFIALNFMMLLAGFCVFNFKIKITNVQHQNVNKLIKFLLVIILISYLLRWYDLFVIRELSFVNEFKYNRRLNNLNYSKIGFLFILASIFKSIYFFPFILCVRAKLKSKNILVVLSYLCLLFPLLEATLKGNRKPMFEVFILVIFTLVFFLKKISLKKVALVFFLFIVLMTLSMTMLYKRESKSNNLDNAFYSLVLKSRYNDFLMPKKNVKSFLLDNNKSNLQKFYTFTFLHTGQYLTHGVFEFNHIIDYKNLQITKGDYNFRPITKLINKTKLFDNIKFKKPSPRYNVYLTAFGGLYLDFRWATLVFMFLFGVLQKYIYQKSIQSVIYTPILIYFLIINVFLLIINLMRGAGIYPMFSFVLLVLILKIFEKHTYEKSSSS